MNLDPSQLPPLRPAAPAHEVREPVHEGSLRGSSAPSPFSSLPYVSSRGARSGADSLPAAAADSTSIDSQTRALMAGMQALGQRDSLGASAARLGALAAQVEEGTLATDPFETALAMMRDEGL